MCSHSRKGTAKNKKLLGGKGANLCEMTQIGLNVPPGFVISTAACLEYLDSPDRALPPGLMDAVHAQMRAVEQKTGKGFGDPDKPLLVSVRSGSAMSMPGMMDTILNLGLNEETLQGEIRATGDARFGYDAYRRFIQLFGKVALGVPDDEPSTRARDGQGGGARQAGRRPERHRPEGDQRAFPAGGRGRIPATPSRRTPIGNWRSPSRRSSIVGAASARSTIASSSTSRPRWPTAPRSTWSPWSSATAATTRPPVWPSPATRPRARTSSTASIWSTPRARTWSPVSARPSRSRRLKVEMPEMAAQLDELRDKLETHYREVQDFEFTIERGQLYCLQTRNGKMNAVAMVRTSVEMEREGLISKEEALLRIAPDSLEQMLFPRLDPTVKAESVAQGLPASPGAASGIAVFDADRAEQFGHELGQKVILVREETKPEDIHGFFAAEGILTSRGGKTSHAAVVARGMGKPCVAGAEGSASM
jgi:pyruvate, orthophosphate dikinase